MIELPLGLSQWDLNFKKIKTEDIYVYVEVQVEQTVPLMLNTAEEALNRLKMPMKPMLISLLPRMRSALPTSSPEDRASRFMFHRLERLERDGIFRSNLKG